MLQGRGKVIQSENEIVFDRVPIVTPNGTSLLPDIDPHTSRVLTSGTLPRRRRLDQELELLRQAEREHFSFLASKAGHRADFSLTLLVVTATSARRRWKRNRQIVPFPHPRRTVANLWCVLSPSAWTSGLYLHRESCVQAGP